MKKKKENNELLSLRIARIKNGYILTLSKTGKDEKVYFAAPIHVMAALEKEINNLTLSGDFY